MSWQRVSDSVYHRPLGRTETIFTLAASAGKGIGRELFRMQTGARVDSSLSTASVSHALKQAWKALRMLHAPDIATTHANGVKVYTLATANELDAWARRTWHVYPLGTDSSTVLGHTQETADSSPLCMLLPSCHPDEPFDGMLVLSISHWQAEASGSFHILDKLFEYASSFLQSDKRYEELVAGFVPGDEVRLLTPSLEDIVMPEPSSTDEATQRVASHFQKFYSALPSLGLASNAHANSVPSLTAQRGRSFTPSSTAALVAACKSQGVSVTAAIHAAFLSTMWHLAGPAGQDQSYACLVPVDVRRRLPPSSPYRHQGCWGAMSPLMLTCPPRQSYAAQAQELQRQLRLPDDPRWLREEARARSDEMLDMLMKSPPDAQASVYVTSIGVVDGPGEGRMMKSCYGALDIAKVYWSVDLLQPGCSIQVWTFRGRLNIQIAYNTAFHGEQQVGTLADMAQDVLRRELGVTLAVEDDAYLRSD